MNTALIKAWLLQLKRDRISLGLTFALPILFFSLFAIMFGSGGGGSTDKVRIAVADEDNTEASRRLVQGLERESSLSVRRTAGENDPTPLTREAAKGLVSTGKVPVAVVIPKGFGESFGNFVQGGKDVELLADTSDPIAPQMVAGLMQAAAMTAAPDLMASKGFELFETYAGAFTPQQKDAVSKWLPMLKDQADDKAANDKVSPTPAPANGGSDTAKPAGKNPAAKTSVADGAGGGGFKGLVSVKVIDVLGEKKSDQGRASVLAVTGTAVMFLLFMASGVAGTFLEEEENGVLERLLTSRVTMTSLLLHKWAYAAVIGIVQVVVMFLWGAIFFHIPLTEHLAGFTVITVATAVAAAAFGMVLATACRTRGQLAGISTIVILTMSAVGGSMMPRAFMPELMKTFGLLTFNGWALDGYYNVFWYERPLFDLWPQVLMLGAMTAVFLVAARLLARRWETV